MKRKKDRRIRRRENPLIKFTLNRKTKQILFLFCLILTISLLALGVYNWGKKRYENYVKFFNEFHPAFAPGDNIKEHKELNFDESFNLLFVGLDRDRNGHIKADAVILIHFSSANQSFQLISLPCKAFYFVSEFKDYFQLDNVYAIGQLETPENGMDLILSTLEENLALSVNGYLAIDVDMVKDILGSLGNIVVQNEEDFYDKDLAAFRLRDTFPKGKLRLASDEILGYIMADEGGFQAQSQRHYTVLNSLKLMLNRSLLFKLLEHKQNYSGLFSNIDGESIKKAMSFVIDNKDSITFYSPGYMTEDVVIKGKNVQVFSPAKFDQRIFEIFLNQDVKLEQARIEIYNGTSITGLAGKFSRYITNFGGDVTRVSSISEENNETLIFSVNTEKYQNTLRNLQLIFPKTQIINSMPDFSVTGDIIIIIGKDSII